MANQEHLANLKKGVEEWNRWRVQYAQAVPGLRGPDVKSEYLRKVDLSRADLRELDLVNADLRGASLVAADLGGADLTGANLRDSDLGKANLLAARLRWGNLMDANLGEANLSDADLVGADLTGASLKLAYLNGADLSRAVLTGADLSGTSFFAVRLDGTNLGDCDLSHVLEIEAVRHHGPSTIGIDTIYRSKGQIPEVFLQGAGVPEPFITNMKALVAAMEPIEFYSCFISYSSNDKEFAERLYADLQQKHVRCWFAPEDMKIGDKIRPRIDEAIRVHDKLLLVLSENALKSTWVEKEVETAFEKERKQGRTVLFPIRLDGTVMDSEEAWAADIRRTRHIGDFRAWKDHDKYKKSFERLIRDLRTEERSK